eukprot:CAMPEP_0198457930 /NCGR_PEP_ID=MMETSP1453-20131121/32708_1 /TAXON_ID=1461543 ORGANISM="Unidentified sp., Strain RCC701" /NCGR_SAMPLE_ID=MMETSP1453 /ASSEMBLY_ACC=CAM_ASM_001118 /LENGTH=33 /DNA_ID= /DNA_START= /DNA_END= /DNA_ORIENTATION=
MNEKGEKKDGRNQECQSGGSKTFDGTIARNLKD